MFLKTLPWIALSLSVLEIATTEKLRCYKGSFNNYKEVDLETPDALINSSDPYLNVALPSIIFIHGWNGTPYGFAVSTLIPTLLGLGEYNVCLLNWEKKASGGWYGTLLGYYPEVVPASKSVGEAFGKCLLRLVFLGLNKLIHLIGHSVGAHVAGYTGRTTQQSGWTIPWITALDGAAPGFQNGSEYKPVDSTCATFVDWVHSDPGFCGLNKSLGHVDFWPNFGEFAGGSNDQPGCSPLNSIMDFFTDGWFCNHNRCIELYNSSLPNPTILEGSRADNYTAWANGGGDYSDINYIGLQVIKTKRGNYYLTTTAEYPFGRGPDGSKP